MITKRKLWLRITVGLIPLFELLPATAGAAPSTTVAKEHLEQLGRFRVEHPQSMVDAASARTVAECAEDMRLMAPHQWTILGRENTAAYYRAFLERFQVKEFRRELVEAADFGGRVGEFGRFTQKLVRKDSGKEYALAGKYLDLWEKAADGKLRLVTQIWNHDARLEFAEDLRFTTVASVQMALQAHVPVKGEISFELAALNQLNEVAISQHDGAVWSQFFADDAMTAPNFAPFCRGRKEIDAYITAHVKELPVFEKLDIRNDRIDDFGAFVVEYATHVANWRSGDYSGVSTGKNLRIWRREPGGALRYFWHISNYD